MSNSLLLAALALPTFLVPRLSHAWSAPAPWDNNIPQVVDLKDQDPGPSPDGCPAGYIENFEDLIQSNVRGPACNVNKTAFPAEKGPPYYSDQSALNDLASYFDPAVATGAGNRKFDVINRYRQMTLASLQYQVNSEKLKCCAGGPQCGKYILAMTRKISSSSTALECSMDGLTATNAETTVIKNPNGAGVLGQVSWPCKLKVVCCAPSPYCGPLYSCTTSNACMPMYQDCLKQTLYGPLGCQQQLKATYGCTLP